jgi:hypothetical protein
MKEKGVELKHRDQAESRIVPASDLVGVVEKEIQSLRDKIADMVVEIPFED